jgi:membrane-bound serine protease (ClpP class)
MMAGEGLSPSFGILGLDGTVALILGAMIDTDMVQFRISWLVLVGVTLASLGMTIAIVRLAVTTRRRRVVTGLEGMIGATGTVLSWNDGVGHIFVHGERWRAVGDQANLSDPVRVTGVNGLTLCVGPIGADELAVTPQRS